MSVEAVNRYLHSHGYELCPLNGDSYIDDFCTERDEDKLGRWLRDKAREDQDEDLAKVWLLCPILALCVSLNA